MINDTIAAISTPLSSAGIGIIRISGQQAFYIIKLIFEPRKKIDLDKIESHCIKYGNIVDNENKRVLDEVLVSFMIGPNTYTREDIIEINCHGGLIVMQSILSLVLRYGARMAEPGEFTKRAFLNGRIDLSQAEAVMDIIHAKTEMALNASVKQLEGSVKKEIDQLNEEVLELIAHVEASIDYPEYDVEDLEFSKVRKQCEHMKIRIEKLIKSYDHGRIIREGIKTVIVGRPNVGKSSLLNALLREQRAIVTDVPGTTRDSLEEYMNIHGIPLKLIDTAGIRLTEDVVEKIGVNKSKELIESADLVLYVIDGSQPLTEEDKEIIKLIQHQKVIVLMNKSDLKVCVEKKQLEKYLPQSHIIEISAIYYKGLEALEEEIKEQFMSGQVQSNDDTVIYNVRQKQSLEKAYKSMEQVIESIDMGMPEDCWAIDLHNVYEGFGEVIGNHMNEDIISKIFSQFCLGK